MATIKSVDIFEFFVNLIKKSLTIRFWQDPEKHTNFLRGQVSPL